MILQSRLCGGVPSGATGLEVLFKAAYAAVYVESLTAAIVVDFKAAYAAVYIANASTSYAINFKAAYAAVYNIVETSRSDRQSRLCGGVPLHPSLRHELLLQSRLCGGVHEWMCGGIGNYLQSAYAAVTSCPESGL